MTIRRTTFVLMLGWAVALVGLFVFVDPVFAQLDTGLGSLDETGLGNVDPRIIIARIIRIILGFLGVVALGFILYAGFVWMTAGGNTDTVKKAQQIMVNAAIGIVIILSSFAITSFILNRLLEATGIAPGDFVSSSGAPGDCIGPHCSSGGSGFDLRSVTPSGYVPIRNVVVQIALSSNVDASSVEDNVRVRNADTDLEVDIAASVSGRTIRVRPTAPCPSPNETLECFDADSTFTVELYGGLQGTNDVLLSCGFTGCPLTSEFSTGNLVDVTPPSVVITTPPGGSDVSVDGFVDVDVTVVDDSGVGLVEAFADSGSIGTDAPTTNETTFLARLVWGTTGLELGSDHVLDALGTDIAGFSTSADDVVVTVVPAWCFSGELDGDETGVDCGGSCGACTGAVCVEHADCSSSFCVEGVCAALPVIQAFSPMNGAVGTYVTIQGADFGTATGGVVFLGIEGDASDDKTAVLACAEGWGDEQIVVAVPEGAKSGPIQLFTSTGSSDTTNDAIGPDLPDFTVNTIQRPNLCAAAPANGQVGASVRLYGNGFGAPGQPNSNVFYEGVPAGAITSWNDTQIQTFVPPLLPQEADVIVRASGIDSNAISFTILETPTAGNPVILAVDPPSGPVGEYLTITGSNFGSNGTVWFTNPSLGYRAAGSTTFPAQCDGVNWTPTQIIVKVPEKYTNDAVIATITHNLTVQRGDATSAAVGFAVEAGAPGPGVCSISPTVGPTSINMDIYGEFFGTTTDTVTFFNEQEASLTPTWARTHIVSQIPSGAVSGPVTVTVGADESNGINYEIGTCNPSSVGACGAGFQCCADTQSCQPLSSSCTAGAPPSTNYLFEFSTGDIPSVPYVLNTCNATTFVYSPSPTVVRSGGNQTCVNAIVQAHFSVPVVIPPSAILVEKCTGIGPNPCATVQAVAPAPNNPVINASSFLFTPSALLGPNSTYRVTIDDTVTAATSGEPLAAPYVFSFVTRNDPNPCDVEEVVVIPSAVTLTDLGNSLYSPPDSGEALLSGASNGSQACVLTTLPSGDLQWTMVNNVGPAVSAALPLTNPSVIVSALAETLAGPVRATLTLISQGDFGVGNVLVNFADPAVQAHWPSCGTACFGASIGAEFNVPMKSVSGPEGLNASTVTLRRCVNELCESGILLGADVAVDPAERKSFTLTPHVAFNPSTDAGNYYAVTIAGTVESQSGVSLTGLNNPLAFPTQYKWSFRMNEDGTLCTIDRVEVVPQNHTFDFVGDRATVAARAFGVPDACAEQGQRIDPWAYNWSWASSNINTAILLSPLTPAIGDLDVSADPALGCSAACTKVGSLPSLQVCGNGAVEGFCSQNTSVVCTAANEATKCAGIGFCNLTLGEECDGGLGCTTECTWAGTTACTVATGLSCCGNDTVDVGEECDGPFGTVVPGCTNRCVRGGAASIGARCGNNSLAQNSAGGGEDCDDGNTRGGDGCSSQCLAEGSGTPSAVCGNGAVETGEECDDGNLSESDSCRSNCLLQILSVCSSTTNANCCGNSVAELSNGEQCDGAEGCTTDCRLAGSSFSYSVASFCGDGIAGEGEHPSCEVSSGGDGLIDPVQISQTASAAAISAQAVPDDGFYSTTITALEATSSSSDQAVFGLSCSCEQSSDCSIAGGDYGCGQATGCCFERPEVASFTPPHGSTVCRNAEVRVAFDQKMSSTSFWAPNNNPALEPVPQIGLRARTIVGNSCPTGYTLVASLDGMPLAQGLPRTWRNAIHRLRQAVLPDADALTSGSCYIPATFRFVEYPDHTEAVVQYASALAPNTEHTLEVFGDAIPTDAVETGVLSTGGVGMRAINSQGLAASAVFRTNDRICELDRIEAVDVSLSPNFFTAASEEHVFDATPLTLANGTPQTIIPLPGVYDWEYDWSSSDDTILDFAASTELEDTVVTSGNLSGIASINVSAQIITDVLAPVIPNELFVGPTVSDAVSARVFLCEVPWPDNALTPEFEAPLGDYKGNDDGIVKGNGWTNFSTLYCRAEALEYNATLQADVIPATALPAFDITQVSPSAIASAGVQKEFILRNPKNQEGIGIRVIENPDALPVEMWYAAQGFDGSLRPLLVDGFRAIQDDRTIYVHALNPHETSGEVEPMIYAISHSQNAGPETIDVYNQLVTNFVFMDRGDFRPVTNERFCTDSGPLSDVSCTADIECQQALGPTFSCSAQKDQRRRDLYRIEDMRRMEAILGAFGATHKHCSVTTNLVCFTDDQCPGAETCRGDVPLLDAGTFIPSRSVSAWPSWNAELGNALGTALPVDPINLHNACPTGSDAVTCWNEVDEIYQCPNDSQVYRYQRMGVESWALSADLERPMTFLDAWNEMTGTVGIINVNGLQAPGYAATGACTTGVVFGSSALCGDGLIGAGEVCEIGAASLEACTEDFDDDGNDETGVRATGCNSTCSGFTNDVNVDGAPDSACVQTGCGNGVVEGVCSVSGVLCTSTAVCPGAGEVCNFGGPLAEQCDDGSFNGQYGFCGVSCTYLSGQYCGDDIINGVEACDKGSLNGQYNSTGNLGAGCSFDCTTLGGPRCGDAELQDGYEECDGGFEPWGGALCYNAANPGASSYARCTSTCDDPAETCGGAPSANACEDRSFCVGGPYADVSCTTDADCPQGVCTAFNTQRSRACGAATCEWNSWAPVNADACAQVGSCGDGNRDAGEQCDDGDLDNNDACTNLCRTNVCGDGFIDPVTESCDFGATANGILCTPGYGDTCNYCTSSCTYATVSGGFCGNEQVDGGEICDGSPPRYWVNYTGTDDDIGSLNGTCANSNIGSTFIFGNDAHVCLELGACNGGSRNGETCFNSSSLTSTFSCGVGNSCVIAQCDASCGSSCPSSYQTQFVLGQPMYSNNDLASGPFAVPGEPFDDELSLYSYQSNGLCWNSTLNGGTHTTPCTSDAQCESNEECEFLNSPDMAQIQIPACRVGSTILADVEYDFTYPDMEVVFVLDASSSMMNTLGSSTRWEIAKEAIEESVNDLFDQYPGVVRMGLVSFGGSSDSISGGYDPEAGNLNCGGQPYYDGSPFAWPDNWTAIDPDAPGDVRSGVTACVESLPRDIADHETLLGAVDAVPTPPSPNGSSTPLAGGMLLAHEILAAYPADHRRIAILLSDGVPWCQGAPGGNRYASACDVVADAVTTATNAMKDDGIQVYTAYFGQNISPNQQCATRSMGLWSSNCPALSSPWLMSTTGPWVSSCTGILNAGSLGYACMTDGDFSYQGNSADAFVQMTQEIIDDILNADIAVGSSSNPSSATLNQGPATQIPLPPGFACDPTEESIAEIRLDFNGIGRVNLSNIRFMHCPP